MNQNERESSRAVRKESKKKRERKSLRWWRDWFVPLQGANKEATSQAYFYLLAGVVGLVMGGVCALFRFLINFAHNHVFSPHGGESVSALLGDSAAAAIATRMLLPAFGGLIVGLLIYRVLKLTGGHGVPSVMRAVATGKVNLSPAMAVKSSSSIITITSGGSCGPEGPIVEIGSVVGSVVGGKARATKEQTATLIGSGAAAGIAGVFSAPIGGVFLALELLTRDFAVRSFGPVVVAAVIAAVTSEALLPNQSVFPSLPPEVFESVIWNYRQLGLFAVLGILCGIGGALMVHALYRTHDYFQRLAMPMWLKPALGGLGVGVVGLMFPNVIGEGYEFVRLNILEQYASVELQLTLGAAFAFLFVALVKIAVTSLTLGSGGTGGAFAPAMVLGAMVGGGFGVLSNIIAPESAPAVPVFALVGMAGTVCSALNVPIAGILIVYEVSGADYRMVLPLMITVAMSAFVSSSLRQGSVYTLSLLRDGFDVDEARRQNADPLARIPVRTLMRREFVRLSPNDPLESVLDAFSSSDDDAFLVVDDEGELLGMVSTRDVRGVMRLAGIGDAIIAADAMDPHPATLSVDATASDLLALLGASDAAAVPIVARAGGRKVVGLVGRGDALSAYRRDPAPRG